MRNILKKGGKDQWDVQTGKVFTFIGSLLDPSMPELIVTSFLAWVVSSTAVSSRSSMSGIVSLVSTSSPSLIRIAEMMACSRLFASLYQTLLPFAINKKKHDFSACFMLLQFETPECFSGIRSPVFSKVHVIRSCCDTLRGLEPKSKTFCSLFGNKMANPLKKQKNNHPL